MQLPDLQRLMLIRDYCTEILQTVNRYGDSFAAFSSDPDYQKSVSFSLLQIGELSGKLSESFRKETSELIPWAAIRGMRNLVAHNYGSVSRDLVWKTILEDIPVLLSFCENQIKV
ncbi:MAG: DUF86 domain-containing protein [Clostridia bacterium]|nr:DUF86 domain-containing protein [Clostridia bacterium]